MSVLDEVLVLVLVPSHVQEIFAAPRPEVEHHPRFRKRGERYLPTPKRRIASFLVALLAMVDEGIDWRSTVLLLYGKKTMEELIALQ